MPERSEHPVNLILNNMKVDVAQQQKVRVRTEITCSFGSGSLMIKQKYYLHDFNN